MTGPPLLEKVRTSPGRSTAGFLGEAPTAQAGPLRDGYAGPNFTYLPGNGLGNPVIIVGSGNGAYNSIGVQNRGGIGNPNRHAQYPDTCDPNRRLGSFQTGSGREECAYSWAFEIGSNGWLESNTSDSVGFF